MRFISFLIALTLFTMILFSACSNNTDNNENNNDTSTTVNTEATDTTEFDYYRNIPKDIDYDGYEFTVMTYDYVSNDNWVIYVAQETMNGEVLNDAAYTRNMEVEEMLNVKIKLNPRSDYISAFRNIVLSDDDEGIDMICFWSPGDYSSYITENIVYDWNAIPYIELDAEWWNQTARDAFEIGGTLFFAVSDFTFTVHQHFRCLFNKNLMDDLQLEYPYQLVYDNEWTYDKFINYSKNVYSDLNGNGKSDNGDRFGIAINPAFTSQFAINSNQFLVDVTDDGFVLKLDDEKVVSIVERMVALADNQDVFMSKSGNDHYNVFNEGRALFNFYGSDPALLRDIDEFDFGYIPYPKYDETQEDYISWSAGGLMAVPISAKDIERTGVIVEALSIASNKYLKDAFIESYIESKVLRDEDSQNMYRLMRDKATYDITFNVDPSGLLSSYAYFSYFVNNKTTDVASRNAAIQDTLALEYEKLFELVKNR